MTDMEPVYNAQPGDLVYFLADIVKVRRGSRLSSQFPPILVEDIPVWWVSRTGLNNEHGYPLNMEISSPGKVEQKILSVFDPACLIVPRLAAEIPPEMKHYIQRIGRKDWIVVRRTVNSSVPQFQMFCTSCLSNPWLALDSTEVAAFAFEAYPGADQRGWFNSKPCLEEGGVYVVCHCDQSEDPPFDYEVNY